MENQRGSALEPREYEHWRDSDLEEYIAYVVSSPHHTVFIEIVVRVR